MNDQDKTKEELIKELQELQQENNSLKALYDKDITERKQIEDALRESQEKYSYLYETAPVGIYRTKIDGSKVLEINDTVCEMLGLTKEELLGQPSVIRWADPNRRDEIIKILKEYGIATNFNADVLKKDGSRISCLLSMKIYKGKGYIEGFIVDITERKRAEETLVKLKKAIYTSGEAIFLTDREGVFTFVNPAFTSLYGFSSDEIVGKTTPRIIKSGVLDKSVYEVFWQTLLNGDEVRGELMNKKKDGTLINIEGSATPIIDEEKNFIGFLGIQRNITERKLAEQELIKAKEKAEESDRLKSAFLANMSHEIRTPMNGILGFARLLKEPKLTGAEQEEYISIIEKSGARMLNIINDIIDISKIESEQMKVSISETNVNEKTESIYAFFKPETDQKGLQFFLKNTLPAKETIIKTDGEKIFAILTNLVKNAIKFTGEGAIEIGYEKKDKYLEFFVKDTGSGVRQEQKEFIFERFRQGSESLPRNYEGAGLGLSISKAYVEMLGGKIWVESEEGKGSVFYFTIPYNVEPEEKNVIKNVVSADGTENQIKNLKILIAEDNEVSAKLITIAVKIFCKEVLKARTGVEAIEACHNNPDIDLVLMDIKMPEMNGYEATRQIRQFNTDVVIIAQTAYALIGDREMAIEAGCNDYISKPIKKAELMALIQKYFNK